jgi:hypothetical protein
LEHLEGFDVEGFRKFLTMLVANLELMLSAFDAILAGVLDAAGGPDAPPATGPAQSVAKPGTTKLVPPG